MFLSVPALPVVKHVVKEPFLIRCGISCYCLFKSALFPVWVWGIAPLQVGDTSYFRLYLPFYLIKYNGREEKFSDGAVQLSLMDDSDIVVEEE